MADLEQYSGMSDLIAFFDNSRISVDSYDIEASDNNSRCEQKTKNALRRRGRELRGTCRHRQTDGRPNWIQTKW